MDYQFTHDWFSHNIESWERWLAVLKNKPDLRALEVGSYEGRATTWLLENVLTEESSQIDCIDPFRSDYFPRFLANIDRWRHRVNLYRDLSGAVLPTLKVPYDLIYIDGDHRPFSVLSDAVMAWPSLKVGGVMIFDDYLFVPHEVDQKLSVEWSMDRALAQIAKHPGICPKSAIDGFLMGLSGQHEIIGQGYQIAIRKLADPGADLPSLTSTA